MKTRTRTALMAGGFLGLLLLLSGKPAEPPQPPPPPPPPPVPPKKVVPPPAPKPAGSDPFAEGNMVQVKVPEGALLCEAPSGAQIGVVPSGVFVKVIAAHVEPYADWVHVVVPSDVADKIFAIKGRGDVEGYLLLSALGGTPPPRKVEEVDSIAKVSASPARVYTEADKRSEVVDMLPEGTEVHVLSINHGARSDFSKIEFEGQRGFVDTTDLYSEWKPAV